MLGLLLAAAGLLDRPAAGGGEGRGGRRPRRLVRGDGAVPPAARPADPAHRHHPEPEGAAGPGARPLRRQPCLHRGRGAARAGAARPRRHPARASSPTRQRPAPAAQALAGTLPRVLASLEDGRARRLLGAPAAAAGGRPGRGGARRARSAPAPRRRALQSGVRPRRRRSSACFWCSRRTGCATPSTRTGPRGGRRAGRLVRGRPGGAARAGRRERRAREGRDLPTARCATPSPPGCGRR